MHSVRPGLYGVELICGLLAVAVAGCGSGEPRRDFAEVSGKVSYQGSPLKMGTITFQPPSGAFTAGEIKPDGTYSLKAVVGPNTVMVVSRDPQPEGLGDPAKRNSATPPAEPKIHVPLSFGEMKSGLSFDVKPGSNANVDFDLK